MLNIMSLQLLNKIPRSACFNTTKCLNIRYCTKTKQEEDYEIPTNTLRKYFSANDQVENGVIYDGKPFKFRCEAGKKYSWCLCGKSNSQPFCDGTHRNIHLKIKQRPIFFSVEKTKDYWLCNCKQTSNRPFCDGTHKREDIQLKKK